MDIDYSYVSIQEAAFSEIRKQFIKFTEQNGERVNKLLEAMEANLGKDADHIFILACVVACKNAKTCVD